MNKVRSIKQIEATAPQSATGGDVLPNFRSPAVTLRILLIGTVLILLQSLLLANEWADVMQHMMQSAAQFMPVLMSSLLAVWAIYPWLMRQPYEFGARTIYGIVAILALGIFYFARDMYGPMGGAWLYFAELRYVLLSVLVSAAILLYFRLRTRMHARALHEAKLSVLRARIRPHFLFNTINAVLGIVRAHPKLAEGALEDMADLFRMAMVDTKDLVPLAREIELARQYLALEKLRLGERLNVDWKVQADVGDALIPPLLLQPLLENAVYHGIESLAQGGCISVVIERSNDELQIKLENPCVVRNTSSAHEGNKMALQNIRERFELLFDVEARYSAERDRDVYRVEIAMPYMKEQRA